MSQKSLIPMCLIILCLLLEFPISTVADNAVPTEQEFIEILKASEEQITSIAAKVKISNTAVQKLGYLAQGVPDTEIDVVFVPEEDRLKGDTLRRVPSKNKAEPYKLVRSRGCKNGPEIKRMDLNQNQGNRKIVAKKYGRTGIEEGVLADPTPWTLTGWHLPGLCDDTPLYKVLTNEGDILSKGRSVEILGISKATDYPGNVLLLEFASKDQVWFKFNIWFDMDRSVRPIRIEVYHDTSGHLIMTYDQMELREIQPGLWYPVKGRLMSYKAPEMTYDESLGKDAYSAMTREERWNYYQKDDGPPVEHVGSFVEVENLVLNATYPPELFQVEFPSKMTVWDAALQASYKMP